jgi:hypothetical protein
MADPKTAKRGFVNLDASMDATREAFADPQVGDRFQEMYSFWVFVVRVDGQHVTTLEASPPCTVPDDGKLRHFATHEQYREAYRYGTNPGYWVRLADRGNDVSGWYEELLPDFPFDAVPEPIETVIGKHLERWAAADGLGYQTVKQREDRRAELIAALRVNGHLADGGDVDA